jgi:hypothetical protein
METYLGLITFGALVGVFGTLIGAGGGFIIAPVLLLLYPPESADTITSISLAVTFANATSGSVAYGRMGRINYKYGLIFAAAAVPGSVLGALSTHYVSRWLFDLIFAVLLLGISVLVFVKAPPPGPASHDERFHLDRRGLVIGIAISVGVGFLSSFLGIGGAGRDPRLSGPRRDRDIALHPRDHRSGRHPRAHRHRHLPPRSAPGAGFGRRGSGRRPDRCTGLDEGAWTGDHPCSGGGSGRGQRPPSGVGVHHPHAAVVTVPRASGFSSAWRRAPRGTP